MRVYRVVCTNPDGSSGGTVWCATPPEAASAREDFLVAGGEATIEPVNVELTQRGIVAILKRYASHPTSIEADPDHDDRTPDPGTAASDDEDLPDS